MSKNYIVTFLMKEGEASHLSVRTTKEQADSVKAAWERRSEIDSVEVLGLENELMSLSVSAIVGIIVAEEPPESSSSRLQQSGATLRGSSKLN